MTSQPDKVAILANRFSGKGPNRKHVDRLMAALKSHHLEPILVWEPAERMRTLSDPNLAHWCRCIVSAGGDGSLADVVNELARYGQLTAAPLATLPLGNENLFARQFGFTRDIDKLVAAIARGNAQALDLGAAGDRLFTVMFSAGFDAEVVHRMARWRAGPRGLRRVNRLSYLPRIITAVRCYPYPRVTIDADGHRATGAHLFVFNLPQYGMHLNIVPAARGDDVMLDWILFQRPGLISMAAYIWAVLRGRHLGRTGVCHGRARRLSITSESPMAMQADGDAAGLTPIEVEVRPAALRVMIL